MQENEAGSQHFRPNPSSTVSQEDRLDFDLQAVRSRLSEGADVTGLFLTAQDNDSWGPVCPSDHGMVRSHELTYHLFAI